MPDEAGKKQTPQYSLAARAGVILSAGLVIVVAGMVIVDPGRRSVSIGYMKNALRFWQGEQLYNPEASSGFLYLPAFAVGYLPLASFGLTVGDLAWRAASIGLLFFALLRVVRQLQPRNNVWEVLGLALLIGLAGAAGAIRNGQSTTLLLAATLLAFDATFDRANARAAAWATLALIAKPLGIVVWLLVAGTRLRTIPWLVAFLAVTLAAPYAVADVTYVNSLYQQFFELLRNISPERRSWTDFMAFFRTFNVPLDQTVAYAIRAIAAVMTYFAVFALMRRTDYLRAAVLPATLACSYMLLFNPRAENNTYILMAVPFGLLAAYMLRETKQIIAGRIVVIACVALATGAFGRAVMHLLNPWSKPFLLIVVLIVCGIALVPDRSRPDKA